LGLRFLLVERADRSGPVLGDVVPDHSADGARGAADEQGDRGHAGEEPPAAGLLVRG
jgi:hypothetical protein